MSLTYKEQMGLAKNLGKISELKRALDATLVSSQADITIRKYAIEYLKVLENEA